MDARGGPEGVTVSVRLIRSFKHRTVKNIVIKNVDTSLFVSQFKKDVLARLPTESSLPPPFRKFAYDTMKIEHQAHGYKSNDPLINKEDDDSLMLSDNTTLAESGVTHETTLSFFKRDEYLEYKEDPSLEW